MHEDLFTLREKYDSDEDFSMALIAEAVELLETVMFREGELLKWVIVIPKSDERGYEISVREKE